jgi:DNA primase
LIAEAKVSEVRERTDIYALVKEYVQLKRVGTSYKGLCPFHGEKTPSFHVHPDRGFFHCFGCQASGDAIHFLMRIDGHAFPDAVRILAERAGVQLEEVDDASARASRQARARRERLHSVLDAAAGFYVEALGSHRWRSIAQAELTRRGVSEETAQRFRLGYAPDGWDELARFLAQRGFSPVECEEVGLLVPRRSGDGHYDRFRHRLMFPVSDPHGRIVAFSGRALEPPPGSESGPESPAKYINSPEGPLYHKGDLLFGLHEARVELRRADGALLCEGNFDVLALSQAGFRNVVAPLGTAFTETQAKLLRRYVSRVVLLFDADAAGRKAVRAAQPLLRDAGLAAQVVTLPPGDDPDSYLRARGAEPMQRILDAAPGLVEHLIEVSAAEAGASPRAKAEAIEGLGPVLASVDNPVEARAYVERVARAFEVPDLEAVRQQLRRGVRSARASRDASRRDPSAPSPVALRPRPAATATLPELEARVVGAFIDWPSIHTEPVAERARALLTSAELRAILERTAEWAETRGVRASALLHELEDGPARTWLEHRLAVQHFEDAASARGFVERALPSLERDRAKEEQRRIRAELNDARRSGDDERAASLMRRMNDLFQSAGRAGMRGPTK